VATAGVGMVSRAVLGITVGGRVVFRTEEPMRAAGSLAGRAGPRSFPARIFAHNAALLLELHGSALAAPPPWWPERASAPSAARRRRNPPYREITRSLA